MRRTIKPQPMSLQEVSERKEQAEQRIHAADGLVATAEERLALLKAQVEEQENDLRIAKEKRAEADQELKNSWDTCAKAKKELLAVQGELTEKRDALTALEVEAATLEIKMDAERDAHVKSIKEEIAAFVVAREKVGNEVEEAKRLVEERRAKAQRLSDTTIALESKREAIENLIASLEPKRAELFELNDAIVQRKGAIVGISEEYARKVAELEAANQELKAAKEATRVEGERVQKLHEDLATREAEVNIKINSVQGMKENLESMRARMIRAEKDAEAKAFLNRGY